MGDCRFTHCFRRAAGARGGKDVHRKALRSVQDLTRRFQHTAKPAERIKEHSRLFRRLLTVHGQCQSAALLKPALESLRGLPDTRILLKSLRYLLQQQCSKHDAICDALLHLVLNGDLPFPYQVAQVFESFKALRPLAPESYASKIRQLALERRNEWVVRQKALEAILTFPYRADYALRLAIQYGEDDHPWVRRAACLMIARGPKTHVAALLRDRS